MASQVTESSVSLQYATSSAVPPSPGRSPKPRSSGCAGPMWSSLPQVCELLSMPATQLPEHPDVKFQHRRFSSGQYLYRIGQRFDHLYLVNSGFLKTVRIDENGVEQVLSFPMKRDWLGVDGIYSGQYASEAIALSDCDIIMVPFKLFSTLGRTHPGLEPAIYGAMSQELIHGQAMVSTLASLGVEARIARFLASLSERFTSMGYSGKHFNLRMTRQEMASYLGTTLETVSRTITALGALGLITVDRRTIGILDLQGLKTLRRLPPPYSRLRKAAKQPEQLQAARHA
jgi:CRP/FNR family transcriptional regulator, anaerobic regulatory protein